MGLIRHRPSPELSSYVEVFWWSQRDRSQDYSEHMLPSGRVQMILALHEEPILCSPNSSSQRPLSWSRTIVHGPQWGYFKTGPKAAGITVGISFRAGAAESILGFPVTELTDSHVSLDELWGARSEELRERLLGVNDPKAAFGLLESALITRLKRPLLIHPAVAHALACRSGAWAHIRVADIQRDAGYSPRHFVALFRGAVGLTPKHYYRIKRFTTALQCLASPNPRGLADLAAAAGYSDQAHLSREFREFAGITPTQYCPRDADSFLHHRVQDASSEPVRKVINIQDSR
jgi:AraC-like DNA-binding protein